MNTKTVTTPDVGQRKEEVREALLREFPKYRIAAIQRDSEGARWVAHLSSDIHHKVLAAGDDTDDGSDGDAPFPLKDPKSPGSDAPDSDGEDAPDDGESDAPDDSGEEKPKEKKDPKADLAKLVPQLKKIIDEVAKAVGVDAGGSDDGDAGPDHGGADVMPDLPALGPDGAGPGGPPGAGPGAGPPPLPPKRPAARPPGAGGGPPVGVPTFTKRKSMVLECPASVDEKTARQELAQELPDYNIVSFVKQGRKYLAKLELKGRS